MPAPIYSSLSAWHGPAQWSGPRSAKTRKASLGEEFGPTRSLSSLRRSLSVWVGSLSVWARPLSVWAKFLSRLARLLPVPARFLLCLARPLLCLRRPLLCLARFLPDQARVVLRQTSSRISPRSTIFSRLTSRPDPNPMRNSPLTWSSPPTCRMSRRANLMAPRMRTLGVRRSLRRPPPCRTCRNSSTTLNQQPARPRRSGRSLVSSTPSTGCHLRRARVRNVRPPRRFRFRSRPPHPRRPRLLPRSPHLPRFRSRPLRLPQFPRPRPRLRLPRFPHPHPRLFLCLLPCPFLLRLALRFLALRFLVPCSVLRFLVLRFPVPRLLLRFLALRFPCPALLSYPLRPRPCLPCSCRPRPRSLRPRCQGSPRHPGTPSLPRPNPPTWNPCHSTRP